MFNHSFMQSFNIMFIDLGENDYLTFLLILVRYIFDMCIIHLYYVFSYHIDIVGV